MNAAAYVRVSSDSQDDASQRHAIRQVAEARGDQVAVWFSEKAHGDARDRAELARLRAAARAGEVRRLYVFKLDRLTRAGIVDTLTTLRELQRWGCEVLSARDGFDLQGPMAEIVVAVMAWAAEMELRAIRERRAAARTALEARGGHWGRPPRVTPDQVEEIRRRVADGQSVRQVAVALRIPRATVARWSVSKVPPAAAAAGAQ